MKKSDKSNGTFNDFISEIMKDEETLSDMGERTADLLAGRDVSDEMGREILNDFEEFVQNADYTPKHIHSGAAIASIVANTMKMAAANPQIENHSTYIVSFPARIVTQIKVTNGNAICIDKGYMEKKK